jgi:hypothetical protein
MEDKAGLVIKKDLVAGKIVKLLLRTLIHPLNTTQFSAKKIAEDSQTTLRIFGKSLIHFE